MRARSVHEAIKGGIVSSAHNIQNQSRRRGSVGGGSNRNSVYTQARDFQHLSDDGAQARSRIH